MGSLPPPRSRWERHNAAASSPFLWSSCGAVDWLPTAVPRAWRTPWTDELAGESHSPARERRLCNQQGLSTAQQASQRPRRPLGYPVWTLDAGPPLTPCRCPSVETPGPPPRLHSGVLQCGRLAAPVTPYRSPTHCKLGDTAHAHSVMVLLCPGTPSCGVCHFRRASAWLPRGHPVAEYPVAHGSAGSPFTGGRLADLSRPPSGEGSVPHGLRPVACAGLRPVCPALWASPGRPALPLRPEAPSREPALARALSRVYSTCHCQRQPDRGQSSCQPGHCVPRGGEHPSWRGAWRLHLTPPS